VSRRNGVRVTRDLFASCLPSTCCRLSPRILALNKAIMTEAHLDMNPASLAPYAGTSLGNLPSDVLIPIAAHVVLQSSDAFEAGQRGPALLPLIAVCSRIREILLAAPELWIYIDFTWEDGLLALCLTCISSQSALYLRCGSECTEEMAERVAIFMPRAVSLSVVGADESRVVEGLNTENAPRLISLALSRSSTQAEPVFGDLSLNTLDPSLARQITSLSLYGLTAMSLPAFPALRRTELHAINVSSEMLATFWQGAPRLEEVTIRELEFDIWSHPPIFLAGLRSLHVEGDIMCAHRIMGMLPTPSQMLSIVVDERPFATASQLTRDARLRFCLFTSWGLGNIWASTPASSPIGTLRVVSTASHSYTTIELRATHPSSVYVHHAPLPPSPLLEHVRTLIIDGEDFPGIFFANVLAQASQHPWLANINKVVIREANYGTNLLTEEANLRLLGTWLIGRQSIRVVEFLGCSSGMKVLFSRLASEDTATEVRWSSTA
jgi:hypothetical protein